MTGLIPVVNAQKHVLYAALHSTPVGETHNVTLPNPVTPMVVTIGLK